MSMLFGVYTGIINTHSFSFSQALCMSMKVFFFIHLAFLMSISLLIHFLLHEHCLFFQHVWWPAPACGREWPLLRITRAWFENYRKHPPSGREWLLFPSGRKWPLLSSGREWPLLSSGRKWLLFPSGRKWPLLSSGREWPQVAAFVEWPQVAAFVEWPQVAALSFFNFHPPCNRCDIAVLELLDTGINSFSCFVLLSSLSKQKLEVNHFC